MQIGLITAIPYTFAAVGMYLWSRHADKTGEHVWHVAIPMLLGGFAIPVALYLHSPVLAMIPVIVAAVGVYSAIPSFWALPSRFLTGAAAAGGIGLINSIGNLGGFAAPYATGALDQWTGSSRAGMGRRRDHGPGGRTRRRAACHPRSRREGGVPRSQPTG